MIITFCGHHEIEHTDNINDWIHHVIKLLILEGAETFYFGGYGAFDHVAANVARKYKTSYPALKNILVLAYLDKTLDSSLYDFTLYPPIESVPLRFAISKRNQWMVENSDVVVAYVTHSWGGAMKTLQYARKKNKRIILFPEFS